MKEQLQAQVTVEAEADAIATELAASPNTTWRPVESF